MYFRVYVYLLGENVLPTDPSSCVYKEYILVAEGISDSDASIEHPTGSKDLVGSPLLHDLRVAICVVVPD